MPAPARARLFAISLLLSLLTPAIPARAEAAPVFEPVSFAEGAADLHAEPGAPGAWGRDIAIDCGPRASRVSYLSRGVLKFSTAIWGRCVCSACNGAVSPRGCAGWIRRQRRIAVRRWTCS